MILSLSPRCVDDVCCVVASSRLQHDIYTIRHDREMSTVQEIHAMLQAHVQLLDQVSRHNVTLSTTQSGDIDGT